MRAFLIAALVTVGWLTGGCAPADSPAALSGPAGWRGAHVNSPDAFRFVVLSDRTGGHEPGALARAIVAINRLKPDFVVSIGDPVSYTHLRAHET